MNAYVIELHPSHIGEGTELTQERQAWVPAPSEPVNQPERPGRTGRDGIGTSPEKVPVSESRLDPGPRRKLGIVVS